MVGPVLDHGGPHPFTGSRPVLGLAVRADNGLLVALTNILQLVLACFCHDNGSSRVCFRPKSIRSWGRRCTPRSRPTFPGPAGIRGATPVPARTAPTQCGR